LPHHSLCALGVHTRKVRIYEQFVFRSREGAQVGDGEPRAYIYTVEESRRERTKASAIDAQS
jgi:hypothetical protein